MYLTRRTRERIVSFSRTRLSKFFSSDDRSVDGITLILPKFNRRNRFPIPLTTFVLGKTTLADVMDKETQIEKDFSSKHWQLSVEQFYGFPGNYNYYTYGVFTGLRCEYPIYSLEWDYEKEIPKSD